MNDMKRDLELRREVVDVGQPAAGGRSPWPWVVLAIVLVPLATFIIIVVITLGGAVAAWHTVQGMFTGQLVMRTDQPAVISQIRQLNRLETDSFTVEKVIEGGKDQGNALLNDLLGDRLLFIAHGTVIAGVDFGQMQPQDITTGPDGSVTLRLPSSQILSHSLDNSLSRVYDRRVGLLSQGDPNLESQVRAEAEQQIVTAACQGGILTQADTNAQTQVRALLQSMGVKAVTFLSPRKTGETGCEPQPATLAPVARIVV
jgi:hypothetical protein